MCIDTDKLPKIQITHVALINLDEANWCKHCCWWYLMSSVEETTWDHVFVRFIPGIGENLLWTPMTLIYFHWWILG